MTVAATRKHDDENDLLRKGQLPKDPFEGTKPMNPPKPPQTPPPAKESNGHAAANAAEERDEWPDLSSFDVGAARPFPLEVFEPRLREFIEGVARQVQMPTADMAGTYALAVLAAACSRRIEIQVQGDWVEPSNLWIGVIGDPGDGKSPVWKMLIAPVREHDAQQAEEHGARVARERQDRDILEKKRAKAEDRAARYEDEKGEAEAANARDYAAKLATTPEPSIPRLLVDNVTPERLTQLGALHGRLAMLVEESGSLFQMANGKYSGTPDPDPFLKMWSSDSLNLTDRSGAGGSNATGAVLTLGLMLQPGLLRDVAAKCKWWEERGVSARFLFCCAPNYHHGFRNYLVDVAPIPENVKEDYRRLIRFALDLPGGPTVLKMDNQARQAWKEFRQEIEGMTRPSGDLHPVKAWAKKLDARIARIAAVLHVAKAFERGLPVSSVVDLATMQNAIKLGRYFADHALAAYADMDLDPAAARSKRIIEWLKDKDKELRDKGLHRHLSETEVRQGLRKGRQFSKAEDFTAALTDLEIRGYIKRKATPREPGKAGRPAGHAIIVRPELLVDDSLADKEVV